MRNASILVLALCATVAACSPTSDRRLLHVLKAQLSDQVHRCVPLGWAPVPVAGTFYPGYSLRLNDEASWIKPLWLGSATHADLVEPQARAAKETLDALVRVGMIERIKVSGGYHYRLTVAAMNYYYDENQFGNNPDRIPYLCSSTLVPDRIDWHEAARKGGFRATFTWHASEEPVWAKDPIVRAHSIIMGPARSPALVKFAYRDDEWQIVNIYAPAAASHVANAAVWPSH